MNPVANRLLSLVSRRQPEIMGPNKPHSGPGMTNSIFAAKRCSTGLSLIELMVTTALLAIFLQIAIPEFGRLLAAWQRDSATRAITDHLVLARSEAIHWSRKVVMCNSNNGYSCSATSDKEWKSGWLVFQDIDDNGQFDVSDKLIAQSQGPTGIKSLEGNASRQRFVFLPTGMMASGMATLEVIPRIGFSQKIIVNRIGRVRLSLSEFPSSS
jgi:type IV fimbrial biogenesis protein FimT